MGAAMIESLNIATMPIADKVHRHMLASYYALQLDALQAEAKRLGYFFAQADTAATMPPVLADSTRSDFSYRAKALRTPGCSLGADLGSGFPRAENGTTPQR